VDPSAHHFSRRPVRSSHARRVVKVASAASEQSGKKEDGVASRGHCMRSQLRLTYCTVCGCGTRRGMSRGGCCEGTRSCACDTTGCGRVSQCALSRQTGAAPVPFSRSRTGATRKRTGACTRKRMHTRTGMHTQIRPRANAEACTQAAPDSTRLDSRARSRRRTSRAGDTVKHMEWGRSRCPSGSSGRARCAARRVCCGRG